MINIQWVMTTMTSISNVEGLKVQVYWGTYADLLCSLSNCALPSPILLSSLSPDLCGSSRFFLYVLDDHQLANCPYLILYHSRALGLHTLRACHRPGRIILYIQAVLWQGRRAWWSLPFVFAGYLGRHSVCFCSSFL